MKRLIYALMCLILFLGSTFILNAGGAYAKENLSANYARAATREAYLYTSYDLSSSLFAVPYTYLVEIIQEDDYTYYVKYAEDAGSYKAVYGYCKKEDFTPVYSTPTVTYLNKTILITFSPQEITTLPALSNLTVEAAYYGAYYSGGKAYSYVLCGDSFGYITGANDDYPLLSTEEKSSKTSSKSSSKTSFAPQIITAVTLCALAAFALVLIFLSSKKIKHTGGINVK